MSDPGTRRGTFGADRHGQQLRFPARNANSFVDQCHKDFYFRCSLDQNEYLEIPRNVLRNQDAALELLPRRERRLVVVPGPVGAGQLQEIADHVKSSVVADAGVAHTLGFAKGFIPIFFDRCGPG